MLLDSGFVQLFCRSNCTQLHGKWWTLPFVYVNLCLRNYLVHSSRSSSSSITNIKSSVRCPSHFQCSLHLRMPFTWSTNVPHCVIYLQQFCIYAKFDTEFIRDSQAKWVMLITFFSRIWFTLNWNIFNWKIATCTTHSIDKIYNRITHFLFHNKQ